MTAQAVNKSADANPGQPPRSGKTGHAGLLPSIRPNIWRRAQVPTLRALAGLLWSGIGRTARVPKLAPVLRVWASSKNVWRCRAAAVTPDKEDLVQKRWMAAEGSVSASA